MTPYADDIMQQHREDVARETDALDMEIGSLQDQMSAIARDLDAAMDRRRAIVVRLNAAVFAALHVKIDADGCPVPRPGPPIGTVRRKGGAMEPPAPTTTTETPATDASADPGGAPPADSPRLFTPPAGTAPESADGYDAFMAAIAGQPPVSIASALETLGWREDERNQYTANALTYAAKHGLGPQSVTRTDDGRMAVDGTDLVIG